MSLLVDMMHLPLRVFVAPAIWLACFVGRADGRQQSDPATPTSVDDISIRDFRPRSMLRVQESHLEHAQFPVIDVHTHFRFKLPKATSTEIANYVRDSLDKNHVAVCISMDAMLGNEDDHLKLLGGDLADRFGVFVHLDWQGAGTADDPKSWACNQVSFARNVVEQLRVAKRKGCLGVKVFKQFGLGYLGPDGELLKVDDPRFDPIWQVCGELEMPVLIHTADPAAFFEPINSENERWEELSRHPDWSFVDVKFPRREELLAALLRLVDRHRKTKFIAAHCANYAEDLETLGRWLEKYPNLYIDFASRIGELGRQPYTARAFLERFNDRVLFGTDGPWPAERLGYYWRFLETFDEHFPYSEKQPPPQGLWQIYGVGLSNESLEKIYYRNALILLPELAERYARTKSKMIEW